MEPITSAAMMGITMTLWILVYTLSGATVIALFAILFLGFVNWFRPVGVAGVDPTASMYRWPMAVSRGWIAALGIFFMITNGLGAAFMLWVGDTCACNTGSNLWITFISLALILPFLVMLAGVVFAAARAFVWHAVIVFFIMLSAFTIFIVGQVYVWVFNNTLYSQLGTWFSIGLVLITPVWFYWAVVFARDNSEMNTPTGFQARYNATFHVDEVELHKHAEQVRAQAYKTSAEAWDAGHNRIGDDVMANYVIAGHKTYIEKHGHAELQTLLLAGAKSVAGDAVGLVASRSLHGVSVF